MARAFIKHFFILLAALFVASCSSKKEPSKKVTPKVKQEIRFNIMSEPQSLDPRKVRSLADVNLTKTFMEGLIRADKTGNLVPAIAKSYKVSEDQKTYTFSLRDSFWSNGDPLTAHDFIYAWKKVVSPNFASDYAYFLFAIKNGKAIKEGSLPVSMLGAYAKDDQTLVIELEDKTPFFLELLSFPVFFPVNANIDRENPNWYTNSETFVCNGPFEISEWRHNNAIIAVKNDLYWDADCVNLDQIDMLMLPNETGFMMFQNNELDWEGSPFSTLPIDALPSLEAQNQIKSDPLLGTYWIRTNTSLFPLHSEEMRKALSLAINREEIVTYVTHMGVPTTSIIPPSMGLNKEPYFLDGDIETAQSYFKTLLEKEKLSKEKFPEIRLSYPMTERNSRIAQALQAQWYKALGIQVKLENMEPKIFFDRISKGDYQLALGSWSADYRDPINFLEVFKTKKTGTNNTNWESPDYQKAIEASYVAATTEERLTALRKAEEIISNASPVIPIFQFTMLHVQNEKLKDVILSDSGHLDFKWARVVE